MYTKKAEPAVVLTALKAKLPKGVNKDDLTLNYIANICCTLMTMNKFVAGEWTAEIAKYLANIMGTEDATRAVEALRIECKEMVILFLLLSLLLSILNHITLLKYLSLVQKNSHSNQVSWYPCMIFIHPTSTNTSCKHISESIKHNNCVSKCTLIYM